MRSSTCAVVLALVAALVFGAAMQAASTAAVAATMAAGESEAVAMAGCARSDGGGALDGSDVCARQCAAPAASAPALASARGVAPARADRRFASDAIVERRDPPEPAPPRPQG